MNKYVVKVVNVFSNLIEVEAEDESGARQKAFEVLTDENNDEKVDHFYESTLPKENWSVITKESFEKLKAQVEEDFSKAKEQNNGAENEPTIITP
jgi:curved DNA-binding protein CbpA